ncbi:fibulin-1-like [Varroa jacobsoni]|uniref:fibulin-1-like n=1 Tax=Varroa jacobsoni TaxID=62625 RepID=UPI000BF7D5A5|nr:fibulin-1-like [Varroa jacobsoni]XP_022688271.1 fibulin-1-like [Varroa jacobsoni]
MSELSNVWRRSPMTSGWTLVLLVCSLRVDRTTSSNDSCCLFGEFLAQTTGGCKRIAANLRQKEFSFDESKECLGYFSRCCRRKINEQNCQKGREHARSGKPCEELIHAKAEECCTACREGLVSETCSAPWLEGEPILNRTFQACCKQQTTHSASTATWRSLSLQQRRLSSLPGPFPLMCNQGYHFNRTLLACEDIDECFLGKYSCPRGTICLNLPGGYECSPNVFELQKIEVIPDCPTGFFYSRHVKDCIDRDECVSGEHICSPNEVCMNTLGNYYCRNKSWTDCEPGYRFHIDQGCIDVDQCSSVHDCSTEEECVDRGGQYVCVSHCHRGYKVDPVTVECNDIDECMEGTHNCTVLETCINQEGSFRCAAKQLPACKHGYDRQGSETCEDINECALEIHNCTSTESCFNKEGGFECRTKPACNKGYWRNKKGECEDIDECKEHREACGPHSRCVNMAGSFVCHRTCGQGYTHDNGTCIDIDECFTGDIICLVGQRCENLEGSARCVDENCELLGKVTAPDGTCLLRRTCADGYYHDRGFDICKDINECVLKYPACAPDQECINTIGSYRCTRIISRDSGIKCPEGLKRSANGTTCEDVDECQEGLHTCDPHTADCDNTFGSYLCHCKEGFTSDWRGICVRAEQNWNVSEKSKCPLGYRPDGENCEDIDECFEIARVGNPLCEHSCVNLPGTYRCTCHNGFEPDLYDPTKCIDVNECERGLCKGVCINKIGSFECTCPPGFVMNGPSACIDIDECRAGTNNCTGSEKCINIEGDFRCVDFTCPEASMYKKDAKRSRCIRTELCEHHGCRLTPKIITFAYKPLKRDSSQHQRQKISVKPTHARDEFAEFTFNVDKIVDRRQNTKGKLATNEDFRLYHHKTWAKLVLRRRLTVAQDIYVTLKAKIYRMNSFRRDELQETREWKIIFYVPQNTF